MADTVTYQRSADHILERWQIHDPLRTPGYPLFLILNFMWGGYKEYFLVAMAQSLLSLGAMVIAYFITFKLTKSATAAFILGLLLAFNYQVIQHEPSILSDIPAYFLVCLTVLFFMLCFEKEFGIRYLIPLNLSILLLISVRPIFIYCLLIYLLISGIYFFKTRGRVNFGRTLVVFLVVVLLPITIYSFAMKRNYGFWGLSNVSQVALFGVVLHHDIYKSGSSEYMDFIKQIDEIRGNQSGKDRYNPHVYLPYLKGHIPQHHPSDFSYLMQFSVSSIKNSPVSYMGKCFAEIPTVLTKMYKCGKESGGSSILYKFSSAIYMNTIYRAFRKDIWVIAFLLPLVFLVKSFRKDFNLWLSVLSIQLFMWLHVLSMVMFSYSDYERLRMPIDTLILICVVFSIHGVYVWIRNWRESRVSREVV